MKNRHILLLAVLTDLLLIILGYGLLKFFNPVSQSRPATTGVKTPVLVASPSATPEQDPLTIDAIAARSYPGSLIVSEQDLGEQGGYKNSIMSYQSDGFKIRALMSVPDGPRPAGGWPVVIFNHGYIDPAVYQTNGPEYREFIARLARAGYVVIKPDYRGHGQSQGMALGGHFSPVYTYDVMNLIASIKQDPILDAKRIGLFGHSLGGHTALRTMVVSKDVKATVFMAGVVGSFDDLFYNWPTSPMAGDQPAVVQTTRQDLIAKYGTPRDNPKLWDSASAINYVDRTTGAVQVNQDATDSVVPKLFADHLVAALQKAGKPVEYHVYPGDDHQFAANRALLLQRVVAFYQAHL